MLLEPSSSSGWYGGAFEVPREQLIEPVLLVAADDGGERRGRYACGRERVQR